MVLDGSNCSRYSTKRSCRFLPSKSSSNSPYTHTNLVTRDAKTLAHFGLNEHLLHTIDDSEIKISRNLFVLVQNNTHLYISNTLCGSDDLQFVVFVRNNNTLMTFEVEVLLTAHSNLNRDKTID